MAEEVKDDSEINVSIKLNSDDIGKLLNDSDDFDDDDVDKDFTAPELKRRIFLAEVIKEFFFFAFIGSIIAFPYEIIMDSSFGLGKAFLLVFWGGTCLLFSSGVASTKNKLRRRLKELDSNSAATPTAS